MSPGISFNEGIDFYVLMCKQRLLERAHVSEHNPLCFTAPETHLSQGLAELHIVMFHFQSCLVNALSGPLG